MKTRFSAVQVATLVKISNICGSLIGDVEQTMFFAASQILCLENIVIPWLTHFLDTFEAFWNGQSTNSLKSSTEEFSLKATLSYLISLFP